MLKMDKEIIQYNQDFSAYINNKKCR
jgi:hypothetical protein